MSYLLDTNILLRSVEVNSPLHRDAVGTVEALLSRGQALYVSPQTIMEFWNAATRSVEKNGLGFLPQEAAQEVRQIESLLTLIDDTPQIYSEWRRLVVAYSVVGVDVFDARLVATAKAHGIDNILTFDRDFNRYHRYQEVMVVRTQDVPRGPELTP